MPTSSHAKLTKGPLYSSLIMKISSTTSPYMYTGLGLLFVLVCSSFCIVPLLPPNSTATSSSSSSSQGGEERGVAMWRPTFFHYYNRIRQNFCILEHHQHQHQHHHQHQQQQEKHDGENDKGKKDDDEKENDNENDDYLESKSGFKNRHLFSWRKWWQYTQSSIHHCFLPMLQSSSSSSSSWFVQSFTTTPLVSRNHRKSNNNSPHHTNTCTSNEKRDETLFKKNSVSIMSSSVCPKNDSTVKENNNNNNNNKDQVSIGKKVKTNSSSGGGGIISKRVSKQIYTCGKNYNAALTKLFQAYSFLQFDRDDCAVDDTANENTNTSTNFDVLQLYGSTRPICATIDILGKSIQPQLGLKLLHHILALVHRKEYSTTKTTSITNDLDVITNIDTSHNHEERMVSFLHLLYKAIIGMIGHCISKQKDDKHSANSLNGEYMMKLLYYELPTHTMQQRQNHTSSQLPPPPIDLYHGTLSALGKCRRMDLIMSLIHDMESNRIIQLDSMIDATPTKEYQLPLPDRTSYTTALTSAIRCKAYNESIQILQSMRQHEIYPNIFAYNQVLTCISNAGSKFEHQGDDRCQLTQQILNEMEECNDDSVIPTESTYQTVMAIYAKENKWDEIKNIKLKLTKQRIDRVNDNSHDTSTQNDNRIEVNTRRGSVESILGKGSTLDTTLYTNESIVLQHMDDLKKLEKMNSKRIWYKLGKYNGSSDEDNGEKKDTPFIFGLQTHRNPSENGLSIVFHDAETQQKLGYMLVRNTIGPRQNQKLVSSATDVYKEENFVLYSSFMGMYIDEEQRGKRYSSKFLAVWLLICLQSNAIPLTEIINKPLLSLVLKSYGFIPKDKESAIEVEICPLSSIRDTPKKTNEETGWCPNFAMYSNKINPKDGTFGERELRIQKMMLTKHKPNIRGKTAFVKTSFDHPILHASLLEENRGNGAYETARNDLIEKITDILGGSNLDDGKLSLLASTDLLRRAVFGYLYEVKT